MFLLFGINRLISKYRTNIISRTCQRILHTKFIVFKRSYIFFIKTRGQITEVNIPNASPCAPRAASSVKCPLGDCYRCEDYTHSHRGV